MDEAVHTNIADVFENSLTRRMVIVADVSLVKSLASFHHFMNFKALSETLKNNNTYWDIGHG